MVRVRGLEYPVCFDLHAESGDVLRLLSDRETGLHFNLLSCQNAATDVDVHNYKKKLTFF